VSYTRDRELPAKVKAANRANAEAKKLYDLLAPIFRPFVGKKIETANGDLLAKIEKLIPPMELEPKVRIYRHRSNYSLGWGVSVNEMVDDRICTYYETHVPIGELSCGILTKIHEWNANYPVYDVETVRALRTRAKEAKKVYEDAKSDCYPFGEE
jgi:hypothetical protein